MCMKLLGEVGVLFIFSFMVFFIFLTKVQTKVLSFFLELKISLVRHIYNQCVDSDANTSSGGAIKSSLDA